MSDEDSEKAPPFAGMFWFGFWRVVQMWNGDWQVQLLPMLHHNRWLGGTIIVPLDTDRRAR